MAVNDTLYDKGGAVYNVLALGYGVVGDGVSNDRGALNTLANTTISGAGGTMYFPLATYRIQSNLTFPSHIQLEFAPGATLLLDSGVTVTVNGPFKAAPMQCISGDGVLLLGSSVPVPRIVHPEWWGVTGIGDHIAIQKAGDALPDMEAGTIQLSDRTYHLADGLFWQGKSGLRIHGPGRLNCSAVSAHTTLLKIEGQATLTETTVSAAIEKGDLLVTVVSTSGFAPGDMISITSTEPFSQVDTQYLKGEIAFVRAVAGSTITLSQAAKSSYSITAETVTIKQIVPITDIHIQNVQIIGSGVDGHQIGIHVRYAVDPKVIGVELRDVEDVGISFDHVENGLITQCSVRNIDGGGDVPGYGYSFDLLSQHCALTDSFAENCRHCFTTGGVYPVWNYVVSGNRFVHNVGDFGLIATHNNSARGTIIGNNLSDSYIGIDMEGPGALIEGNTITGITYCGVCLIGDGVIDAIVAGNLIRGARGISLDPLTVVSPNTLVSGNQLIGEIIGGVEVGQGVSCASDQVKIVGNEIRGFSPGITCQSAYVTIRNNEIVDIRSGQPYGIYLISEEDPIVGIHVIGNRIYSRSPSDMTDGVLIASGCEDVIVEGNHIDDFTNTAVNDAGGMRTRIRHNWFSGTLQRTAILGTTTAGITNGTLSGRMKTTNMIVCEIDGRKYTFAAADPYWSVTGASTGAMEFRKVALAIASNGIGEVYVGLPAASQAEAMIPDWIAPTSIMVGFVEIPNNYVDGSSLGGFVCVDYLGQVG